MVPLELSPTEGLDEVGVDAVHYFENVRQIDLDDIEEHSVAGTSIIKAGITTNGKLRDLNDNSDDSNSQRLLFSSVSNISSFSRSPRAEKILSKDLLVDIVYALLPYGERNRSDLYENGNYFGCKKLERKLKELFDVDDEEIIIAIESAKSKKLSDLCVEVGVLEARNLRAKIQKALATDSSNPYCVVHVASKSTTLSSFSSLERINNSKSWKTNVAFETTNPLWNSLFNIDGVKEGSRIFFEVWHHINHETVLNNLKDKIPFGLQKVLKKETKNFLGCATVDLELCLQKDFDGWVKLSKPKEDEHFGSSGEWKAKRRGEVHVTLKAKIKNELSFEGKENFRGLLNCIAHNYEKNYKQLLIPWNGSISSAEKKIIDSYCATFNISILTLSCNWWIILSTGDLCCDYKYMLSLATDVQHYLENTLYNNEKEKRELEDSVIYWMNLQIIKIKTLDNFFPSNTLCSKEQLTHCLRILKLFEEKLNQQLLKKTLHPYNLCISEALQEYVTSWWNKKLQFAHSEVIRVSSNKESADQRSKNRPTAKKRNTTISCKPERKEVITLSDFRATNLNLYRSFREEPSRRMKTNSRNSRTIKGPSGGQKTNNMLLNNTLNATAVGGVNATLGRISDVDAGVIALKEAAIYVDGVHDFLLDIVNIYDAIFYTQFRIPFFRQCIVCLSNKISSVLQPLLHRLYRTYSEAEDLAPKSNPLALERGTPAYQIFFAIRKIEMLCRNYEFSSEIQLHSGFLGYWKWFSKGTKLWLRRTNLRTQKRIVAEVEEDDLQVSQENCKYSFSAINAVEVHKMILSGWRVLQWPEEDSETEWLMLIGEVLSSLGVFYSTEINRKLSAYNFSFVDNDREHQLRMCHAVNNFALVNESLYDLPQLLKISNGYAEDTPKIREDELSKLQKLIDERRAEIDSIADSILESVVEKLSVDILKITKDSCKLGDDGLVTEFLNREVWFFRTHLLQRNFQRFLMSFWSACLRMYRIIIEENKYSENFKYFQCLFRCFENSSTALSQEELDIQLHLFEDYNYVSGLLSHLKLTTETLIANYYFERFQEQENLSSNVRCFGDLALRGSISWTGKLSLEVIMARNLEIVPQATSKKHLFWRQGQKIVPDTYVTVKLVPAPSFPGLPLSKTRIMKKSLDPVYNSTFEFDLGDEKSRLDSGLIQLLIYKKGSYMNDSLIGETLLPLNTITRIPLRAAEISRTGYSINHSQNIQLLSCAVSPQPQAKNVVARITKPRELKGYDSLKFLEMRRNEKSVDLFLRELRKS